MQKRKPLERGPLIINPYCTPYYSGYLLGMSPVKGLGTARAPSQGHHHFPAWPNLSAISIPESTWKVQPHYYKAKKPETYC